MVHKYRIYNLLHFSFNMDTPKQSRSTKCRKVKETDPEKSQLYLEKTETAYAQKPKHVENGTW